MELWRDILYALRSMRDKPATAAVAVIALALGIGANTAVFSVIHAVFLRPLPHFREADRIVQLWGANPARNVPFHSLTYSDVVDIRRHSRSFEEIAAMNPGSAVLAGASENEPERVSSWKVDRHFFPLIGNGFACGRGFLPEEDRPGAPRFAVLSYGLWKRRFGENPAVVGSTILVDREPYIVTGVVPRGFALPAREIDLYTTFSLPEVRDQRNTGTTSQALARLRPRVTMEAAQQDLERVRQLIREERTVLNGLRAHGLRDFIIRDVRRSLLVLLAAVLLVLLMACANVANLLLARGTSRQREMAVRLALGASRGRLIRQMMAESAVLAAMGAVLGVGGAVWGVSLLPRLVPAALPLVGSAAVDSRVLLFTIILSLLTTVVSGIAPALAASRGGLLAEAMQQGSRGSGESFVRNRLRAALLLAEVSLAMLLLAGAGLLIRSFANLNRVHPGFDPRGVLTASVNAPSSWYRTPEDRERLFERLLDKVERAPGVEAVGAVNTLPMSGSNSGVGFFLEGQPAPRPEEVQIVWFRAVSAGYLRALRIPLAAGRWVAATDTRNGEQIAVINQTLARRHWPGENAVGRRFTIDPPRSGRAQRWITVVGVIGDIHHQGPAAPPDAEVYFPYTQGPFSPSILVVRTQGDPERFTASLRTLVREVDAGLPISQPRTLEKMLADSLATARLSVAILSAFAGIALLLAAVGIYGVISFSVARRTREIGIRMALGAMPGGVARTITLQALSLALIGITIGVGAALALTRTMSAMLYGVKPTDPWVLAGAAATLTAVAALSGWLPARRAAKLDPLTALREE